MLVRLGERVGHRFTPEEMEFADITSVGGLLRLVARHETDSD